MLYPDQDEICRTRRIPVKIVGHSLTSSRSGVEMTRWRVLAVLAAGVIFIGAGVAAAGNFASSAQTDYYAAGQHEFYMWCPASQNYMTSETGRDAEDAQMRLY